MSTLSKRLSIMFRRALDISAVFLLILSAAACGCKPGEEGTGAAPPPSVKPARNVYLFLGDSLTAGYGVTAEEAFPALLGERWREEGIPFRARNGGAGGMTTAVLLDNLDWHLTGDVHTVFLCIGANDGLRGRDLGRTKRDLDSIIRRVKAAGPRVVLAGVKIPPNYGAEYSRRFEEIFPALARSWDLKIMPFLLEGVGGERDLNIQDGIHPNPEGHRLIARNVHAFLESEGLLK
ncbi:MAG: arylesterase [Elusimicrobiota bacterium]